MAFKQITSAKNPYIKELVFLKEKSKVRKQTGQFLIEGRREILLALKGAYEIETIFFYPELFSEEQLNKLIRPELTTIEISKEVYQKLAYRETTEGVLALAKMKSHSLENIKLNKPNPLILVAEAPEKPGNIGALLRTADAAHLDAVIIANPKTDLYNPNIIRSSIGCIFTNQIAMASTTEIIEFLNDKNIQIYASSLEASVDYHTQDFTKPTALVVGTESTGLSQEWIECATQNIIIPMQGEIDSMNVSVAAGIIIFEAKRQRDFN